MGNNHPTICPYGAYEVKNKEYVIVGAGTNEQFKKFVKLLGLEYMIEDTRFSTNESRVQNRSLVD